MKILSKKDGINIYDELNCDACGEMSGPRSLYDRCLKCGATREERVVAGRKKYADLILRSNKTLLEVTAKDLSERLDLKIDLKVEYEIA